MSHFTSVPHLPPSRTTEPAANRCANRWAPGHIGGKARERHNLLILQGVRNRAEVLRASFSFGSTYSIHYESSVADRVNRSLLLS